MDYRTLPLYFLIGGTIVTLATYFGSQARGLLAAFVVFFPSITLVTFCTIYFSGGAELTTSYAKSLLMIIPAWLIYIVTVMYLLPRLGLFLPLVIGVSLYGAGSVLTMWLAR